MMTDLSLYDLQEKVWITAAAESVSNMVSLIQNFELFQDGSWRSHSQATVTPTSTYQTESLVTA